MLNRTLSKIKGETKARAKAIHTYELESLARPRPNFCRIEGKRVATLRNPVMDKKSVLWDIDIDKTGTKLLVRSIADRIAKVYSLPNCEDLGSFTCSGELCFQPNGNLLRVQNGKLEEITESGRFVGQHGCEVGNGITGLDVSLSAIVAISRQTLFVIDQHVQSDARQLHFTSLWNKFHVKISPDSKFIAFTQRMPIFIRDTVTLYTMNFDCVWTSRWEMVVGMCFTPSGDVAIIRLRESKNSEIVKKTDCVAILSGVDGKELVEFPRRIDNETSEIIPQSVASSQGHLYVLDSCRLLVFE